MLKQLISALVITSASLSVAMADNASLLTTLKQKYPATQFKTVKESEIKGIYEVVMGKNVAYTDKTGDYFLFGNLIRMKDQADLTKSKVEEANKLDFAKLPFHQAIKFVAGNGQRKIAVFSDPDCPYCKRFEHELAKLDNITIYIFENPITELHPDAIKVARQIWCSKDQQAAWRNYLINQQKPDAPSDCENPVNANIKLAQQLGLNGTPMSVLEDGNVNVGASSAVELDKLLNDAHAQVTGRK